MAKQKKKRNKKYTGANAASAAPTVTRVSAINRNKPQQWWFEKKRIVKPIAIAVAVVFVVVIVLIELIQLIF